MLENNAQVKYIMDLYTSITLLYNVAEKETRKLIQKMFAINFFFLIVAIVILTVSFGLPSKILLLALGVYCYIQFFYSDTVKVITYFKQVGTDKK